MNTLQKILLLTDGLYIFSGGLIGPIYALFVDSIGGDLLDASSTFAFFMLTAAVVVYFLALWEDKSKHLKKFVIAGYGLGVIGYLGYLFVDSPVSLFVVQIILGFSIALKDPAFDALFSSSEKHLALAWGEWEATDYFVLGLGALFGGFVAQNFGFRPLLFCMFFLSIASFFLSIILLRMQERKKNALL